MLILSVIHLELLILEQPQKTLKAAHKGYELLTLQKAAIGTISNTKVCDVTEIGLKSKVFKQVTSFPNVNSHPGAVEMDGVDQDKTKGVVKRYQDDDGSISSWWNEQVSL